MLEGDSAGEAFIFVAARAQLDVCKEPLKICKVCPEISVSLPIVSARCNTTLGLHTSRKSELGETPKALAILHKVSMLGATSLRSTRLMVFADSSHPRASCFRVSPLDLRR